ncbi:uncharacterized protein LOC18434687 [Amborella trichopoda]|uniref:RNase H type-1 domain-containing protein n=1 Tax=Amborella trichopoda TaxID=13333 RepID=W1PET7_AMBTC|nr:uncharacterized protein LOC18434687 [Amborella trichopoda]ERN06488.1 hypothetical protein AMTR_s00058p00043110 [Amborella trichopoda]|eukprot:XP_006844813.1 uncharacterized protein LOC18434687 [Amborella trichopoda]
MEDNKASRNDDAPFYVVRKGDMIGVYRSLEDCRSLIPSSVRDPSVTVYKGQSLSKELEAYLLYRGLKNAVYSISSKDASDELLGSLMPCNFQEAAGCTSFSSEQPLKCSKLRKIGDAVSSRPVTYLLEFDGASKGNPGKGGAGAIIRTEDGRVVCQLREGLGVVTNNVAEYRALILGMKFALKKGFDRIRVQGDSMLVCMQIQDIWKTKNKNIMDLSMEAKELKKKFTSFQINHVGREYNSEADALANAAIGLGSGEVREA